MQGSIGVWRSLVAHLHGVQGVEGSNPFTPTKIQKKTNSLLKLLVFFICCATLKKAMVSNHRPMAELFAYKGLPEQTSAGVNATYNPSFRS